MFKKLRAKARLILKNNPLIIWKYRGSYWMPYMRKLYSSPSQRQAKILRAALESRWSNFEFDIFGRIMRESQANRRVVLDVGANIGYTALGYARELDVQRDRIICFEPSFLNQPHLRNNLLAHAQNIQIAPFGLSSREGSLRLGIPNYADKQGLDVSNTGLLSSTLPLSKTYGSEIIAVLRLDLILNDLIEKNEKVVFVKIDVEGAEKEVLLGASELLKNHMPAIQLEYNPNTLSPKCILEIIEYMAEQDYSGFSQKKFEIEKHSEIYFINNSMMPLHEKTTRELRELNRFEIQDVC